MKTVIVDKYWGREATDAEYDIVWGLVIVVKDNQVFACEEKKALLEYAFECSLNANAMNWNYIHGVIQRLKERNISSVEQAYEYDFERENGK